MQYGMLYIHKQGVHGIVSRKSSGYIGWGFIEISFEKNGCMLLNDIGVFLFQSVQSVNLFIVL